MKALRLFLALASAVRFAIRPGLWSGLGVGRRGRRRGWW